MTSAREFNPNVIRTAVKESEWISLMKEYRHLSTLVSKIRTWIGHSLWVMNDSNGSELLTDKHQTLRHQSIKFNLDLCSLNKHEKPLDFAHSTSIKGMRFSKGQYNSKHSTIRNCSAILKAQTCWKRWLFWPLRPLRSLPHSIWTQTTM